MCCLSFFELSSLINCKGWYGFLFCVLQLSGSIATVVRGGCDFTTKAEIAQSEGAAALLVINDKEGCSLLSCWNAGELVIYPSF